MLLLNKQTFEHEPLQSSALLAGKFCLFSSLKSKWMLDNRATDHICYDLTKFESTTLITITNNQITISDVTNLIVTHKGTVKLSQTITLHDVLYMPNSHSNLISITKLCVDLYYHVFFFYNMLYQDLSLRK